MTTAVAAKKEPRTLKQNLTSDEFREQVAKALPAHCKADRMIRVALNAVTRTPKLAQCDQASFFKCLLDLSQWGLEPDGRRAHLIPFNNRKRQCVECQLIIDYKGYVELVYRAKVVKSIHADVVREGDTFEYNCGEVVRHVPWFLRRDQRPAKAGEIFAVYCMAELDGGMKKAEVLSLEEVEAVRKRSMAGNDGPWVTDWTEMAKKTAFRRLSKWLPLSAEVADAFDSDADRFEPIQQAAAASITLEELAIPESPPEPADKPVAASDLEKPVQAEAAPETPPEAVMANVGTHDEGWWLDYNTALADAGDADAVAAVRDFHLNHLKQHGTESDAMRCLQMADQRFASLKPPKPARKPKGQAALAMGEGEAF